MHVVEKIPWIQKHLEEILVLNKSMKKLISVKPGIYNEFEYWTPLKLVFLKYCLDIYTKIIPNFQDYMFYLDLFSGSGIDKFRGKKEDFVIGSPLVSAFCCSKPFEKMYFIDSKPEYTEALKERMNAAKVKNCCIMNQDCNEIDSLLDEIYSKKKTHAFVFVDPYSLEIKWGTIKKILEKPCDLIITFMTQQIARAVGQRKGEDSEKLNNFFGDDSWKGLNMQELVDLYVKKIENTRKNSITETVEIKGGNFKYHLIFVARRTRKGSPWMGGIRKGKREVEKITEDVVRRTFDVMMGRIKPLRSFY